MENQELKDLYRELILDHARNPRNFGRLTRATHTAEGINPLCGDKLHIYFEVEKGTIRAAAFEGSGCAISVASASLLTDAVTRATVEQAKRFFETMTTRLTQRDAPDDRSAADDDERLIKLRALEGVREFPTRVKCATLAWHAMQSALQSDGNTASTE